MESIFCAVPSRITATSSRFYESIYADCIPVLVSNRFQVAFTNPDPERSGTAFPTPVNAINEDAFVLRWPEDQIEKLPQAICDMPLSRI